MTANALSLAKRIDTNDPAVAVLLREVEEATWALAGMEEAVVAAHETLRMCQERNGRRQALLTALYIITTEAPRNTGIDGDDWPNTGSDVWLNAVLAAISAEATS